VVRLPKARNQKAPFFKKGLFYLWILLLFPFSSQGWGDERSVDTLPAENNYQHPSSGSIHTPSFEFMPHIKDTNEKTQQIVISSDQMKSEIFAVYAPKELTLDENPQGSFWQNVPELKFAQHRTKSPASASVKIQWDMDYLYILFDIKDTHVESSVDVWDGDSVSFIIRNRERESVYKYRYDISGPGEGNYTSKMILKENTTLNDSGNQDNGFWVFMKIKWQSLRTQPFDGARLPINLISVNHDGKPGAKHDETGVEFSKIIWDRKSADTTNHSLVLIGGYPSPVGAPQEPVRMEKIKPDYDRAENALLYFLKQQDKTTGLFKSYDRENISHTYDQALALANIASEMELLQPNTNRYKTLFKFGDKLAKALVKVQNDDGSWNNAYEVFSTKVLAREKYVGVISWTTYALMRYGSLLRDQACIESAKRGGKWLKAQFKKGALIHTFQNGTEVAITEANINAWYAFHALGEYQMASEIQEFLMERLWDDSEGYFYAGYNITSSSTDTDPYLDNQTLGAYFLKLIGEPQKAAQALRYAKENFGVFENGKFVGLDGRTSKMAVWLEGTFFYILAGGAGAQELLQHMNGYQNNKGGFPHDTKDIIDPWHTQMIGINATIWGQQANLGTHLLKIPDIRVARMKKGEVKA
jgi:hypothetical protein